jgi:hypothetical protein
MSNSYQQVLHCPDGKDFIISWIVHCTQTKQTLLYIITQQKIVNEQEKAHNVLPGMLKQTDNIVIPH